MRKKRTSGMKENANGSTLPRAGVSWFLELRRMRRRRK